MHKVLPNLFISSHAEAQNKALLLANEIRYIISIRCADEIEYIQFHDDFIYLPINNLEDWDTDGQPEIFAALYPVVNAFIDAAQGNVLVHCLAGVSRSAAFVVAYIAHRKKLSAVEALEYLNERYPRAAPLDEFLDKIEF